MDNPASLLAFPVHRCYDSLSEYVKNHKHKKEYDTRSVKRKTDSNCLEKPVQYSIGCWSQDGYDYREMVHDVPLKGNYYMLCVSIKIDNHHMVIVEKSTGIE